MIHHRVFPLKHFVCLCAQVDRRLCATFDKLEALCCKKSGVAKTMRSCREFRNELQVKYMLPERCQFNFLLLQSLQHLSNIVAGWRAQGVCAIIGDGKLGEGGAARVNSNDNFFCHKVFKRGCVWEDAFGRGEGIWEEASGRRRVG